jgi:hypothetical protein
MFAILAMVLLLTMFVQGWRWLEARRRGVPMKRVEDEVLAAFRDQPPAAIGAPFRPDSGFGAHDEGARR